MRYFTHDQVWMIRQVTLVLISALTFIFALVYSHSALAMGLKGNGIIERDVIMLSDVFYGLPEGEDKVLGAAPRPGKDMILNARTLLRIALALDLPWRPVNGSEEIVLSRAATIIGQDTLMATVKNRLTDEGIAGLFEVVPDGQAEIVLPPDFPATAEIQTIDVNNARDRFEAILVAPSLDNPVQRLRVAGRIERMTEVPVLLETIRNGTLIKKSNIQMISMPTRMIDAKTIIDPQNLIGNTPRRMVSAGQPIKSPDVEAPQIVARGEFVTMTFQQGPLVLTAQGRALEDGAKGDVIRVVNTGSNQTIEAMVTNLREVSVQRF